MGAFLLVIRAIWTLTRTSDVLTSDSSSSSERAAVSRRFCSALSWKREGPPTSTGNIGSRRAVYLFWVVRK